MSVNVLKKRLISCDPDGEVVNSKSTDNSRLVEKLCGCIGSEKSTKIHVKLVLYFAFFSIDEINVKFAITDIFTEILP